MPVISMPGCPHEVFRGQPVRRLRRPDRADDRCRLAAADPAAPRRRSLRAVAPCLASRPVPVRGLPDPAVGDRCRCGQDQLMPDARSSTATLARDRPAVPPAADHQAPVTGLRAVPVLITLIVLAVAGLGVWAAWQAYIAAPWTRDGTVRAYVVTITPEVSGLIVQLPVADNQFVHQGDLLMAIDPTDYAIAVDQAQ